MRKTNRFTRKTICTRKTKINILMYCLRIKAIVLRVKTSVLRVKHWINDPFGHKLQFTLINVKRFTRKTYA